MHAEASIKNSKKNSFHISAIYIHRKKMNNRADLVNNLTSKIIVFLTFKLFHYLQSSRVFLLDFCLVVMADSVDRCAPSCFTVP